MNTSGIEMTMLETDRSNHFFLWFHSKCFWSAKLDCAWFAFSDTRFIEADGLQHSNDHDNTVNFHVFDKLIMRHELMIIGADSCLHEVMARDIRWIATCFKIKVNLRMEHFLKPVRFSDKYCRLITDHNNVVYTEYRGWWTSFSSVWCEENTK